MLHRIVLIMMLREVVYGEIALICSERPSQSLSVFSRSHYDCCSSARARLQIVTQCDIEIIAACRRRISRIGVPSVPSNLKLFLP
jgi:hypothetical protein